MTNGEQWGLGRTPVEETEAQVGQPAASIEGFIGLLAGRSSITATLEDIQGGSDVGWAGIA